MGLCASLTRSFLNIDKILENINRFFAGLVIRQLGIDKVVEKVKQFITSGQATNSQAWSSFLNEEIYNSNFSQTSQAFVIESMNDAQNTYGDQLLPLLSLLFLCNSDQSTFVNAFKAVNLAKNAQSAGGQVQNAIQAGMQGGFMAGLAQGFGAVTNVMNVANQAQNPNMISRTDLRNLCSYFVNFVTLMPVNLIAKYGEGSAMKSYFTDVLNSSFDKSVQDRYVESTLFGKYSGQDTVDVDQFFNDNYNYLKDDSALRRGLVDNYVSNLSLADIKKIVSGGD